MFSGKRGTRQISYVQKHTRVNMVATDWGTEKKTFDGAILFLGNRGRRYFG